LTIPVLPVTALTEQRIARYMRDRVTVVQVHLHVNETIKRETLWNTVGVLRGTDPTHTIVLGGHRDAWVYGVTDNGSGISVLLETAHALGYLYKSGWRPRFSIVIAGFDGEEIGEAGSQAYVRMHQGDLQSGCVAYINEDEAATGQRFGVTAAAALEDALTPAAQRVRDPREERQTLYDRWKRQPDHVTVDGPGGGSDFEPFLYDAGVPMMELAFEGVFGVYHSAFDDLRYAQTQADPGLVNHRAVAQLLTLLTMRLSDGTLAYRFSPYATRMRLSLAQLAVANGVTSRDIKPVASAIDRFASHARTVDSYGMNGNDEITAVHRLNRLYYGRNGYAAVAFPALSEALATHDEATISAAVGRTVHDLDGITATMRR
jgi:N-acetylated-alpha-linked acidic dipeptidase